jgi:dolichol kinase
LPAHFSQGFKLKLSSTRIGIAAFFILVSLPFSVLVTETRIGVVPLELTRSIIIVCFAVFSSALVLGRPPLPQHVMIKITHAISAMSIPIIGVAYGKIAAIIIVIVMALAVSLYVYFQWVCGINVPVISKTAFIAGAPVYREQVYLAPIYGILSVLIVLILFAPEVAYAAISTFALGDSASGLVGRKLGKHKNPLNKNKSIEGSLSGFILALIGASLFTRLEIAVAGAAFGMISEALPLKIDDNFTVPLAAGAAMWLMRI